MRRSDQELRTARMVFYAEDVERLDRELDGFLEASGARCAMLIDTEGHLVTRRGEAPAEDVESLSAVVAGSSAPTHQVGRRLGEGGFNSLAHQGEHQGIQLASVGPRALMATVWDDRTNLGLVKFYAQETSERLRRVLGEIEAAEPRPDAGLADDYGQQASAALDELF